MDNQNALEQLKAEAESCRACALNQPPYNPGRLVFGVGSGKPKIVFAGEGPGEREAIRGAPFVGPAGQLLQQGLREHGYKMSDIYVLNAVKHRPPGNRTPNGEEIRACSRFLVGQISALQPVLIVALGKVAAFALADASEEPVKIPKAGLRGLRFATTLRGRAYPVLCTWHPAYCLRNESATPQMMSDLQRALLDVQKLETLLGEPNGT